MATKTRGARRAPSPARRAAEQKKVAADILAAQRSDIAAARDLYRHLVDELKIATQESAASASEDAMGSDNDKKIPAAMIKAASLAGRATVMRDLFSAMRVLVDLERDVFDLAAADEADEAMVKSSAIDSITASLARLAAAGTTSDES